MSSRCLSYPVHITTSSSAQCRRKNDVAVIHQHMLALPRRSVFRVSDTSLVCTPEFAFVEIAGQGGSVVELLELGYEMCGTYRARLSCEPKGRTPVLPERVATAVIPDGGGRSPARAVDVVSTGGLRAEVAAPPLLRRRQIRCDASCHGVIYSRFRNEESVSAWKLSRQANSSLSDGRVRIGVRNQARLAVRPASSGWGVRPRHA